MLESRWLRRAGPGLAALGAAAAFTATALGAGGRPWEPPPCPGSVDRTETATETATGVWWRLDPRLSDGALTGQSLALGAPGSGRHRVMELAAESFAAGPFGGLVLVGSDDGHHSNLSLVDPRLGCAWPAGTSDQVVRKAALTRDGTAIIEFRLDRATRAEAGVFRRPLAGDVPESLVLGPIRPDPRFGPTWATDLAWSVDGQQLAVQSCGAIACRVRVVNLVDGAVHEVEDPANGDMVGLADGRLVVHEACGGLPCPLVSIGVQGGDRVTLHQAAGQAVVGVAPDGRARVVHEVGADGRSLRAVGLLGDDAADVPVDPSGRRLVAGPGRSSGAADVGLGVIAFGPDGRLPLDGSSQPAFRRLADGASLSLDEVSR